MEIVHGFKQSIPCVGWTLTLVDAYFPDFGDSVASSATFYLGVHKSTCSNVKPIRLHHPPDCHIPGFESYLYKPFNKRQFAVYPSCFSPSFDTSCMIATDTVPGPTPTFVLRLTLLQPSSSLGQQGTHCRIWCVQH